MDIEKLKELYATGNYVCYYEQKKFKTYVKALSPALDTWDLVMVHKKHEYIVDKVIDDKFTTVYAYGKNGTWTEEDFFLNYDEHTTYSLEKSDTKPQKQNFYGGYIKASQEARNLLEANGKVMQFNYQTIPDNDVYFLVSEHGKGFIKVNKDQLYDDQKQFYINNGALSWDKLIELKGQ